MLYLAKSLQQLRFGDLMEVYMEGNLEKAAETGLLQAGQDFYQYLRDCFFPVPGAVYAVWVEGGEYISALRLEPYKDGLLLEALETAPKHRRKGYAQRLIRAVLAEFPEKIYSHVSKNNAASLAIHEKCGFSKISESAVYIDGSVNDRAVTLCRQSTLRRESL
ncbi:MAG: GNAT family N-acetyltransferase [Oscillospiraceae bacterium]|nr:GNAT family N-acetyltransferase [Oscillospiraceae bacterium]